MVSLRKAKTYEIKSVCKNIEHDFNLVEGYPSMRCTLLISTRRLGPQTKATLMNIKNGVIEEASRDQQAQINTRGMDSLFH